MVPDTLLVMFSVFRLFFPFVLEVYKIKSSAMLLTSFFPSLLVTAVDHASSPLFSLSFPFLLFSSPHVRESHLW